MDMGLNAAGLLLGAYRQQAVGIHGEGHTDAGRTSRHGRDAAQLETRQAAAVRHQVALALHYMDGQGRLTILVRSEEHTSELQSQSNLVCRLLLEKKKTHTGHGHSRYTRRARRASRPPPPTHR